MSCGIILKASFLFHRSFPALTGLYLELLVTVAILKGTCYIEMSIFVNNGPSVRSHLYLKNMAMIADSILMHSERKSIRQLYFLQLQNAAWLNAIRLGFYLKGP